MFFPFLLDAYYTEDALEHLRTVDDIPVLSELRVPHECYQRARASGSSTSSSTGKKATAPTLSYDSETRRERPNFSAVNAASAVHRYAPFPPSPVASNSSSRTSRGGDSPSRETSPLNCRFAGNPYKTSYSCPPPLSAPSDDSESNLHSHSPHHVYPHAFPRNARHTHTPPPGVHRPPLSVPSQGPHAHAHPLSSSSSTSSASSSSSQLPALSYSATTATPTPTTASPYAHRYPTAQPTVYSPSPSPSSSASPSAARTPPLSMELDSDKRRHREERTLVPLAALRLSDARPESSASGGRKRYRIDEEVLRNFKSF